MIRDLTAEEKASIKKQKDKANKHYNEIKKSLTQQLREASKGQKGHITDRMRQLQRSRDAVPAIKGTPVVFLLEGKEIKLNYDLIKKALRLTKGFTRTVSIEGLYLIIQYENKTGKGRYEFIQLGDEYTLLELPAVELEGVYYG
ncbi:hypothetical protein HWB91_gp54 [Bacillus phage vB_BboS-125]|uniref:Uncharacterized protein n=1 Tax=Bacillus phage vB_BboS-125 TaxID=2419618 RepID=A0A3G3BVZ5_9CAUD|nr:hypothetical protein HWB91_gp54 [Bacillus phage vB_BboS-125]AYP68424.1 hypothetical protein BboS125_00055 [Bacillus phage vB_BboS-125]